MEQEISVPGGVATALFYGIETELSGYPREASSLDDSALLYLYPLADKDLLARIRNARLPQSHFECILHALQSSIVDERRLQRVQDSLEMTLRQTRVADAGQQVLVRQRVKVKQGAVVQRRRLARVAAQF